MTGIGISVAHCSTGNLPPANEPAAQAITRNGWRIQHESGIKKTRSFFPRIRDGIRSAARRVWRFITCRPMPSSRPELRRQSSAAPLLPNRIGIETSTPSEKSLPEVYTDIQRSAVSVARMKHSGQFPIGLNKRMHSLNAAFDKDYRQILGTQAPNLPSDIKAAAAEFWKMNLKANSSIMRNGADQRFPPAYLDWMKTVCDTAAKELGEKLGVPASVREMYSRVAAAVENAIPPDQAPGRVQIQQPANPAVAVTESANTKKQLRLAADVCLAKVFQPYNFLSRSVQKTLSAGYRNTFISFATAFQSNETNASFSLKAAIWAAHGLALASIQLELPDESRKSRKDQIDTAVSRRFAIEDFDKKCAQNAVSRHYGGLRH